MSKRLKLKDLVLSDPTNETIQVEYGVHCLPRELTMKQVRQVINGAINPHGLYLSTRKYKEPSERTLKAGTKSLVDFIKARREQDIPWPIIHRDWCVAYPDRVPASIKSFQANYYLAKRALSAD